MATTSELLIDAFGRVHDTVHNVVEGLPRDGLTYRPGHQANPVGWLVWHLTRVQDDHIAGVAASEQRWTAEGWDAKFALPFDRLETGYGQDAGQTGLVAVEPALLLGYHDAVHATTVDYVRGLGESDLDRDVDTRWDPHVTLGVRLVSIITDDLQHAGQAAYVRGLFERSGS
jgi:hypothetical protein